MRVRERRPDLSEQASVSGSVAVIGAGSIGVSWAIVFASVGHSVRLYEPASARRHAVPSELAGRLADLARFGLVAAGPEACLARIAITDDFAGAIAGAAYVQECVPEDLDLKRRLFAELDARAPAEVPLASSSSFLPASAFAAELAGRSRCLVAHPGNPPTLLRVVEIVPAPFTDPAVADRAEALLRTAGMEPVRLRREVEGFVFNRLQGAVLREAYCLVRDGVVGAAEIDRVMTGGLGPRWAVIGPFETSDLNTRGGIVGHAERMGPAYARMGAERGQHDPWSPELVARVAAERRAALPLDRWDERVAWRDRMLMALLRARREQAGAP
jgi:L-gulonate 3-dehydrogenase